MADDIALNKAATIERCLDRIRSEYRSGPDALQRLVVQDSIVLNLQRATQAAIDLAMHLVRRHSLGLPQHSRDAFRLLEEGHSLPPSLSGALQRMVGFRNIAVHDYQTLNLSIIASIVEHRLEDLEAFAAWALRQTE